MFFKRMMEKQNSGMARKVTAECGFGASVAFSIFDNIFVFVKG